LFLKDNDMMAYLTHMAVRLVELHRVLKPTGSIYLHCDPTASHYLKLIMDAVFGVDGYKGEMIWKRTNARGTPLNWPRLHDVILVFWKSTNSTFNVQKVRADVAKTPHTLITVDGVKYQTYELTGAGITKDGETGRPWRGFDPTALGRHWGNGHAQMDAWDSNGEIHWPRDKGFPRRRDLKPFDPEGREIVVGDVWVDIDRINQSANERLGYPTQKPVALLERILSASSNPGDVVLDPFCGCGTTVHAAEKLGRQWIGIDITHLSISLIEKRLKDAFPGIAFEVHGAPKDLEGARDLSNRDKYQFQWWAVSLVDAVPYGGKKKGADGGIDGHIFFKSGAKTTEKAIVSVKGGGVSVRDVRELTAVVDRERAKIGVYISLEPHTGPMVQEAASAGLYDGPTGKVPKIQLFTIEELFAGKKPQIPLIERGFKAAAREQRDDQSELDL